MDTRPRFSIIIPVYNRPAEIRDLVDSLLAQTCTDFELIIVEDGSTEPCRAEVEDGIARGLKASYYHKKNEGRSIARNYGLERASGDYFIFFDSDCVIPPQYFEVLKKSLDANPVDCFGGPDAAHKDFSDTQKAINYAMTSFLTTGGIRGGKVSLEKFTPRTFNMGFSRKVYEHVGGFREMFSEDIDMSTRIRNAGFGLCLIPEAFVWHKRRIDFRRFFRQVYVFGMSRITLHLIYKGSLKAVHTLPALFVAGSILLILAGIFVSPWFLLPLGIYFGAILIDATVRTNSLKIGMMAVPAAAIQLYGYGCGFLKAWFTKIIFRNGRNINEEIEIRKGK